jgi:putative colanic acid biosysnthesis UDP-glucose lipid carrier transferase
MVEMPLNSLSAARLRTRTIGATSLRSVFRIAAGGDNILGMVEAWLDPAAAIGTLLGLAWFWEGNISSSYLVLSIVVFALTFPATPRLNDSLFKVVRNISLGWLAIAGLVLLFISGAGLEYYFDIDAMEHWLWLGPTAQFVAHLAFRMMGPWLVAATGQTERTVIVGMNDQGVALALQLQRDAYHGARILGFFDDRKPERLPKDVPYPVLGTLSDLPRFPFEQRVDKVYLSLPMATQPRISQLLDALRDTTASIYFVPDIFVTDLIQGRMGMVGDMPVVGVCETPFVGLNGIVKRCADFVLATLILALCLPLMLIISVAVKVSSPGPVFFRQRRYGLDGEEIIVYKFRSMRVCEDGTTISQAQKEDPRTTRLGSFLRKTSLDELPQFINVLEGKMSIVGPRPHAVAHNEMYRKLIKGYMVRHKVKPGITGWAQVNGFRGETESLEKMQMRVRYDLDYLRNWSLLLDLKIIFKTIGLIVRDVNAY